MNKKVRGRNQMNNEVEIHYCCAKGDTLFHTLTELGGFSNENDFFSIDDPFKKKINLSVNRS
jgi:hypothetical protein